MRSLTALIVNYSSHKCKGWNVINVVINRHNCPIIDRDMTNVSAANRLADIPIVKEYAAIIRTVIRVREEFENMVELNPRKVYVRVNADFTPEGQLIPRVIIWRDGNEFEIDRVLRCCRRASLRAGGIGMRYTCLIRGQEHYLFYEDNYKWFVETGGAM